MNNLTLIIPFRNEKGEVRKTINSFLSHAESEISIILINDASSDNYNYEEIVNDYKCHYIVHKQSLGVASSREDGIAHCQTSFFLIIDAHMRAYQQGWDLVILRELQNNRNAICCCKTICLDSDGIEDSKRIGCGCYFNFIDLTYSWNLFDNITETIQIPCLMGASYACNKEYWNKLHGLKGLKGYGFDEQYISVKAFLEGGSCKIINELTFGHIFRKFINVPYEISTIDFIFNQLYIVELFFPFEEKINYFKRLKSKDRTGTLYNDAVQLLKESNIENEKAYYSTILIKSFSELVEFNKSFIKDAPYYVGN